jgi:predicted RNase H-like nuclease (RuvC/YqgF family)
METHKACAKEMDKLHKIIFELKQEISHLKYGLNQYQRGIELFHKQLAQTNSEIKTPTLDRNE